MLEKLFDLKCLDYSKLIRKYYKDLNLDEITCLVAIEVLDIYAQKGTFVEADLSDSCFSHDEIGLAFNKLLELDYVEIFFNITSEGKHVEAYRFTPLFLALERAMNKPVKQDQAPKNEISSVFSEMENSLKRVLTASEMEQVKSWFTEHNYFEIMDAISYVKEHGQFRVSSVEKKLYKNVVNTKPNAVLKDAFANMGAKK